MTLSEWTAPLLGAFSRGRGGTGLGQYGAAVELTALAAACGALAWGVAASRRSAGAAEFAEMRRLVREACEAPAKGVLDAVVDEMVEDMIEKETLDYKELQTLVEKYYPGGIPSVRTGLLAGSKM